MTGEIGSCCACKHERQLIVAADTVTVRAKRDAVQLRSGTIIVDARA